MRELVTFSSGGGGGGLHFFSKFCLKEKEDVILLMDGGSCRDQHLQRSAFALHVALHHIIRRRSLDWGIL